MSSGNIFNNYEKISDLVNRFGLSISYYPSSELEFHVDGYYSLFRENSYLNFMLVELGIDWARYLKGRSFVYITGGVNLQQFSQKYDYYNYYQPFISAGLKYYLKSDLLLRAFYEFYYTDFKFYPDYSNQRHYLTLQLNKFFPSAVTLRSETGLGMKVYRSDSSSIKQVYGKLRLSKGIDYRVGVYIEGLLKKNSVEEAVEGRIEESFFTSPFYDDLSWDGGGISSMVKAILPFDVEASAQLDYYGRNFPHIRALDLEGNPLEPEQFRKDRLTELTFAIARKWRKFRFSLSLSPRKNSSNDPYFQFSDRTLFLSLRLAL